MGHRVSELEITTNKPEDSIGKCPGATVTEYEFSFAGINSNSETNASHSQYHPHSRPEEAGHTSFLVITSHQ